MKHIKFTEQELKEAVSQSETVVGTMRLLGYKKTTTGSASHMRKRIDKLAIDTSHFIGKGWSKGIRSNKRLTAAEILVHEGELFNRPKRHLLKRALFEMNREYICEHCGTGNTYNDKPITLDIDHIDGNWSNNLETNLRFLCPNCHSQTKTFGNKKKNIMPLCPNRQRGLA